MGSQKTLREKMFGTKKRERLCSAETCLKSFQRDQFNVKLPPNGKVTINWDPKERTVEYVIHYEFSRMLSREFDGVTSEMMVDFLKELRGRYPKMQITNTIII